MKEAEEAKPPNPSDDSDLSDPSVLADEKTYVEVTLVTVGGRKLGRTITFKLFGGHGGALRSL